MKIENSTVISVISNLDIDSTLVNEYLLYIYMSLCFHMILYFNRLNAHSSDEIFSFDSLFFFILHYERVIWSMSEELLIKNALRKRHILTVQLLCQILLVISLSSQSLDFFLLLSIVEFCWRIFNSSSFV